MFHQRLARHRWASQHKCRDKHLQRGLAFASTMLVLLGVMAILLIGSLATKSGNGLMTVGANGLQMSSAHAQSASAFSLADSGIEMTLQWLSAQSGPPAQIVPFAPALWGASLAGSPARATLGYPDRNNPARFFSVLIYPDLTASQKSYLIESIGNYDGKIQIIRAYVRLVSYGHYAYLSNTSSPASFWANGVNAFTGPVHCNNADGAASSVVWKSGATQPIFQYAGPDAFTVSGTKIRWCAGSPSLASAPQSNADWNTVTASGKSGVHLGTPAIPVPTSSQPQKLAALSGTVAPSQTGVLIPSSSGVTSGGIYIHGEVDQITFGTVLDLLGHSTIQQITINQHGLLGLPLVTTITSDPTTNRTTFTSVQTTVGISVTVNASYTGVTNGVIYCDGNVGGQPVASLGLLKAGGVTGIIADNVVSGSQVVHANAWTVATDASKSLYIDGNVTYRTSRTGGTGGAPISEDQDSGFTTNAGMLGLISGDIEVGANTLLGIQLLTIRVDAALLAFDTCEAANHSMLTAGVFTNNGNFVVGHDGSFGTLNSGGSMVNGYATTRYYDTRLDTNPPPAYPAANMYQVLSWQNVAAPL